MGIPMGASGTQRHDASLRQGSELLKMLSLSNYLKDQRTDKSRGTSTLIL